MKCGRQIRILSGLLILGASIALPSCGTGADYPSLKVVNQYDGQPIKAVALVGYDFKNLMIPEGGSQVFALDAGMPGGYTAINITIGYGPALVTWSVSGQFDFEDGEVTTITLQGSSAEGHPYYNNPCLE